MGRTRKPLVVVSNRGPRKVDQPVLRRATVDALILFFLQFIVHVVTATGGVSSIGPTSQKVLSRVVWAGRARGSVCLRHHNRHPLNDHERVQSGDLAAGRYF